MRLLLLPLPSNAGREDENLAGLDRALGEAPPVDLAVAAEAFGQGFEAITDDPRHDLAVGWEESGPEIAQVREMARRHRTAIGFGFIERAGDVLHSSAIVVDREGATLASTGGCRPAGAEARWTRPSTSTAPSPSVSSCAGNESRSPCAATCGSCPSASPSSTLTCCCGLSS
ncbi:hypothetical protein GCM10027030_29040 [Luteococcus sediminum]